MQNKAPGWTQAHKGLIKVAGLNLDHSDPKSINFSAAKIQ